MAAGTILTRKSDRKTCMGSLLKQDDSVVTPATKPKLDVFLMFTRRFAHTTRAILSPATWFVSSSASFVFFPSRGALYEKIIFWTITASAACFDCSLAGNPCGTGGRRAPESH